MLNRLLHYYLLFLLTTSFAVAQSITLNDVHAVDSSSRQETRKLHFQHFNVEDGLSQGTISSIIQDHNGFMWFGTYDGLNRFDGINFKTYRHIPNDSTSLGDNTITCLYEDQNHVLWVGTQGGLYRFDGAADSFSRIHSVDDSSESIFHDPVYSVGESGTGARTTICVASNDMYLFDAELQMLRPVLSDQIRAVIIYAPLGPIKNDHSGSLLVGGSGGLFRFDPHTTKIEIIVPGSAGVSSIVVPNNTADDAGWIGNRNNLTHLDLKTGKIIRQWPLSAVALSEDHHGRLWIGTNKGLMCMSGEPGGPGKMEPTFVADYTPGSESGLTDSYISAIYEDASGSLWIGTLNGINRLDESAAAFTVYRHDPKNAKSLAHNFILPITEDGDGNIWFGTFGGGVTVLHQNGALAGTFTHLKHDSLDRASLCGDNVRSMLYDRTGTVWIGTDEGLNAYDTHTRSLKCHSTIPYRHSRLWVEALCEGRDGTIWAVVSGEGLMKIERVENVNTTSYKSGIKNRDSSFTIGELRFTSCLKKYVSSDAHFLHEDRHGTIWIGTNNALVGFDPRIEKVTRYVHNAEDSTSLTKSNIWSIYEDPNDSTDILWVGTNEGLNKFDIRTGKCVRYIAQEGFPSSCVYGILQDDSGRLWLSTNHGLTCFDDRQPEGMKFQNYDVTDGVQGNEFNRRSFCRLRSGEFLFGGTHGVTRFHPSTIQRNPYVPPVILTSFTKFDKRVVFDRDIADVSSISLNYDEDVFSFEFAALNYTHASKNRYAYMMEGFDKQWIHSGARRYVSYTHLDPGTYVFKVKASNNDGVWNESGAAVNVIIAPPFWGTWWFRALSSVSIFAGLFLFYRRRVYGLEKEKRTQQEFSMRLMESQENERKRIAGELHDSLGQDLLVVRNRALLGLKDETLSEHLRSQLDQITSVATQAINNVREISHDLRPYQLDRLGLAKAIKALAASIADSSSIHFSIDIDTLDNEIGKDQAIHVYRIVQEGINNILKHSGASEARVAVQVIGKHIRITIHDNGKGMPSDSSGEVNGEKGFGLIGITERASAMDGTVTIESMSGKGTILTVTIPGRNEPA